MVEEQTPTPPAPPTPPPTQGSTGMEPNVAALVAYLGHIIGLGWLSGLIIFLIEKDDKFVRFHALQSIALGIVGAVLGIVWGIIFPIIFAIVSAISGFIALLIGGLLSLVFLAIGVVLLIFWILAMIKAYNSEMYKIPIIGDMVEKYV